MLYHLHEAARLALAPARLALGTGLAALEAPANPWRATPAGSHARAALDSLEHLSRRFGKPAFGLRETVADGRAAPVREAVVHRTPWCDLVAFERHLERPRPADPRLLLVAPLSGHHATLLRGTVEAFLPDHEVFVTDWRDAALVPVTERGLDLDGYVDHVVAHLRHLGPGAHVVAVCQPAVPVLAAAALMNEAGDPCAPASMTLIGGPIDTRRGVTEVNRFALAHDLDWFRRHVIHRVPVGRPGALRLVYPGFLQLAGFMAMNLGRHVQAHWDMFRHLVEGDGEPLAAKRAFYEEYRAVIDLNARFYLETVERVFREHLLPRGLLTWHGRPVRPEAVTRTALLTLEGGRDDISGLGQTEAAHALCRALPDAMREHHVEAGAGHYGLFNGRRFREALAPRIRDFVRAHGGAERSPDPA